VIVRNHARSWSSVGCGTRIWSKISNCSLKATRSRIMSSPRSTQAPCHRRVQILARDPALESFSISAIGRCSAICLVEIFDEDWRIALVTVMTLSSFGDGCRTASAPSQRPAQNEMHQRFAPAESGAVRAAIGRNESARRFVGWPAPRSNFSWTIPEGLIGRQHRRCHIFFTISHAGRTRGPVRAGLCNRAVSPVTC